MSALLVGLLLLLALGHDDAVHDSCPQPAHFGHCDAFCQAWLGALLAVHLCDDALPAICSDDACGRSRRRYLGSLRFLGSRPSYWVGWVAGVPKVRASSLIPSRFACLVRCSACASDAIIRLACVRFRSNFGGLCALLDLCHRGHRAGALRAPNPAQTREYIASKARPERVISHAPCPSAVAHRCL
jgi:hypothetical protein